MNKPRSIIIFLLDGEADGIRTAQIQMSTIFAVAFRRNQLKRAVDTFAELSRPGVYLLYGPDPADDSPTAYIGESQNVSKRLGYHATSGNREDDTAYGYWSDTIALVNKDDTLTKGHAMQIEAQLIKAAQKNPGWTLRNGKGSDEGTGGLPLHDLAACDEFAEQCKVLVGSLGIDLFRRSIPRATEPDKVSKTSRTDTGEVQFQFAGRGFDARMSISERGDFVVLEGSRVRTIEAASLVTSTRKMRKRLMDTGMLVPDGESYRFTAPFAFKSISAAASTVSGTSTNGRTAWRTSAGLSYADWETAQNVGILSDVDDG